MLDFKATDRICIAGYTGTGKSVFLKWMCRLAAPRIYIIDPLNQYMEFGDVGDVLQGGTRFIPRIEHPQELEDIAHKLHQVSNITLVIEEAEQYLSQGRPMLPYTSSLIRMGRNWGIGVWATTRRVQDINKRFFDLAQHAFFFRCGLKSREYIADMLGAEYMYRTKQPQFNRTGYVITTLPQYHTMHYNLETEEAQVITLKLGAREHVVEVSAKSKARLGAKGEGTEETMPEKPQEPQGERLWTPQRKPLGQAQIRTGGSNAPTR